MMDLTQTVDLRLIQGASGLRSPLNVMPHRTQASSASLPEGVSFSNLQETGNTVDSGLSKPDEVTQKYQALAQFETMVLNQFLTMMLKHTEQTQSQSKLTNDFHNSILAQSVAENITKGGGLGIAKLAASSTLANDVGTK